MVALAGDGAMQMNGINELITVSRMWPAWDDPRLPILVLDNGDLNEVTWEQREMEGDPMFPGSQQVPSLPYAEYALLLGLHGTVVDSPEGVVPAWEAALSADRPFLMHAVVDPAVPLLPPRLEPSMKEKLLSGLDQEATELAARGRSLVLAELADPGGEAIVDGQLPPSRCSPVRRVLSRPAGLWPGPASSARWRRRPQQPPAAAAHRCRAVLASGQDGWSPKWR